MNLLENIENQQWKFARTYVKTAPHEYFMHDWNIKLLFKRIHQ